MNLNTVPELGPLTSTGFAARTRERRHTVPLAFLMDPANHQLELRHGGGRERLFYVMSYGDRYIWGITAGILRTLYERVVRQ
jgi:hypothetical protein